MALAKQSGDRRVAADDASSRRILIVEDDRLIAMDLAEALERMGYAVCGVATSARQAQMLAHREVPDMVLMDIRIEGDIDGIETAGLLKDTRSMAIVFLTANTDHPTFRRALDSHPGGYLAKPFSETTLRTTLELAWRNHEQLVAQTRDHQSECERLERNAAEWELTAQRLRQESTTDVLTGLYNRRYLETALAREVSLAQRGERCVAVIMLDLDHFKAVNDKHGHAGGDAALKAVGTFVKERIRLHDIACRSGGEEMLIVLPGTSGRQAMVLANDLREGIENLVVEVGAAQCLRVTASMGVAEYSVNRPDVDAILKAADLALYRAKSGGRNRVEAAQLSAAECP
jgi:two-component system, cell cycle response regulator